MWLNQQLEHLDGSAKRCSVDRLGGFLQAMMDSNTDLEHPGHSHHLLGISSRKPCPAILSGP